MSTLIFFSTVLLQSAHGGRPPALCCSSISISCTWAPLSCRLTLRDELFWVWNVFPWQHCSSFPLALRQWLSDARWYKLFAQKINQLLSGPLPRKSELHVKQKTISDSVAVLPSQALLSSATPQIIYSCLVKCKDRTYSFGLFRCKFAVTQTKRESLWCWVWRRTLAALVWKMSGTTKTPCGCPANYTRDKGNSSRAGDSTATWMSAVSQQPSHCGLPCACKHNGHWLLLQIAEMLSEQQGSKFASIILDLIRTDIFFSVSHLFKKIHYNGICAVFPV